MMQVFDAPLGQACNIVDDAADHVLAPVTVHTFSSPRVKQCIDTFSECYRQDLLAGGLVSGRKGHGIAAPRLGPLGRI